MHVIKKMSALKKIFKVISSQPSIAVIAYKMSTNEA